VNADAMLSTPALPARLARTVLMLLAILLAILLAGHCAALILPGSSDALAANPPEQTKTIRRQALFLPFSVEMPGSYAYLRNGLSSMLASRLATRANIIAVPQGAVTEQMASALKAGNYESFGQQLRQSGADYLIMGSLAPSGENFELTSYVFSKNASQTPRKFSHTLPAVENAMTAIDELAWQISSTVFGKPRPEEVTATPAQAKGTAAFQTAHPERVYRENLFAGSLSGLEEGSRFDLIASHRSRKMPMELMDINAGDLDGNGAVEIVLLGQSELLLYRLQDGQFQKIFAEPLAGYLRYHGVTLADLNGNGLQEIYVSASAGEVPESSVYEWDGRTLRQLFSKVRYYLRAMPVPGDEPVLLGQSILAGEQGGGSIYRMIHDPQHGISAGEKYPLPAKLNLFDFAVGDLDGDSSLEVVAINADNRMQVFAASGALLWTSTELYGASDNFFGTLSSQADLEKKTVYVNTRVIITDLDGNGQNDVLVGRNRLETVAFMPNLRYFDGSSITAHHWANGALAPLWETQKLPGYTVNYQALRTDKDGGQLQLLFADTEKGYPFMFWQSSAVALNSYILRTTASPE
jgi:hypothetical protein